MTEIEQLESMIATLELENRLMRARNERLEKEIEELRDILTLRAISEKS
jgi:cell division protein FtsB